MNKLLILDVTNSNNTKSNSTNIEPYCYISMCKVEHSKKTFRKLKNIYIWPNGTLNKRVSCHDSEGFG